MKIYILSLGAGLLVGVVYSLLNVRSPAPPVVALVGLLGILLSEQVVPLARRMLAGHLPTLAVLREESAAHVFGLLPGRGASSLGPTPTGSALRPAALPTDPA